MIVKNNLSELDRIFYELETVCSKFGFSLELQNNLCLCVDEVFSNIVKHAYDDDKEHEIEILFDFDASGRKFSITISDFGKPFNPLEAKTPDLTLDLQEREIGGLGLFIVSNIMSSLEYKRHNCMNRLKMTKIIDDEVNGKTRT